jgi:ankyrin repeat protein
MLCYQPAIKFPEGFSMKWSIAAAAMMLATSGPALAQVGGMEAYEFVKAVRAQDNNKAMELLRSKPTIIDARGDKGQTALLAAIGERDPEWTGFLLMQGADPNMTGQDGERPLVAAARMGFEEAVEWLLTKGAKVDGTNRRGETALIAAVQSRQGPIVSFLLANGADPDRNDSLAGLSARDYAKRDTRSRDMLKLIEAKKPAPIR